MFRYLVVEVKQMGKTHEDSLHLAPAALHNSIMQKVQQLHGDFGVAAIRAGFTAKYCNEKTRIAIIRIRHGPHKLVASVLPCLSSVDNKQVVVNSLYTGATLRQCHKFLVNYQQNKFDQFCVGLKTDREKLAMREALLNLNAVLEMN